MSSDEHKIRQFLINAPLLLRTKTSMMEKETNLKEDAVVLEDNLSRFDHDEDVKRMTRNESLSFNVVMCPLHHQEMLSFCLQDKVIVCHKCLLYGDHKFHESLDLEISENKYEVEES